MYSQHLQPKNFDCCMGSGFRDFQIAMFWHETWLLAKVPEVAHIPPKLPTESQISFCFGLRLAISKTLAILHFPTGHNVKFQSFLNSLNFKI